MLYSYKTNQKIKLMVIPSLWKSITAWTLALLPALSLTSCAQNNNSAATAKTKLMNTEKITSMEGLEKATFGTGCFWCTEAMFESLDGVLSATSGYEGGETKNPTYKEVCSGETGHAECVEVVFDPKKVTYAELLEAFFRSHDPTQFNRQGADVGTQYRSVVFFHNEEQKRLAQTAKDELNKSEAYNRPIVTEISAASTFYPAEDYHQNYYANNPEQGYCSFVIAPKLDKFKKVFKEKLKGANKEVAKHE